MTAPDIDTIASSLRRCSLAGRRREPSPERHPAEASGESAGVTVELNSETALPYHWEQCLDIRTGEVYYINWATGARTTEDPRTVVARQQSYYSDVEDASDNDENKEDNEDSSSEVGGYDYDDNDDSADSSSSLSSTPPRSAEANSGQILVAAGCKTCFMYFMVPKHGNACPKCGGGLLHLGRNGCV